MFKRETFLNLNQWLKEVEKHANNDVSIIIIANKADRAAVETPEVSEEDMEKFMQDTGLKIFTASAKAGTNVESCFLDLTSHLIDKYDLSLLISLQIIT